MLMCTYIEANETVDRTKLRNKVRNYKDTP